VVALVGLTVSLVPLAARADDPAVKCESGKLKEASKYSACRLKADAKAVKKGEAADYAKCEAKFADKWGKTETKAGVGICPSEGDQVSMDARITADAAEIAIQLSGVRYEDTGLGTVIDHETGLEWQKTDAAGGLTDTDNSYTWSDGGGGFTEPDGTAFIEFLYGLNDCESGDGAAVVGGYGGHCDWRMPQIDELLTIADCSFGAPCIDESVFGDTTPQGYWSASADDGDPLSVWGVSFSAGSSYTISKGVLARVRAVRGGS
jgi:hypothetical protein